MKNLSRLIIGLIVLVFLAACITPLRGGGTTSTPPSATETPVPTRKQPTKTSTPVPALTLRPTITAVNTPTLTPTLDPTLEEIYNSYSATEEASHLSLNLSLQALSTTSASFPNSCTKDTYGKMISPDGQRLAEYCPPREFRVSNLNGNKIYTSMLEDFYLEDPAFPNLWGSLTPFHWTNDNKFIYFTVSPEGYGDGGNNTFADDVAPMLVRLSVKDGSTRRLFGGGSYYFSFSPTDRRLIAVKEFTHPVTLIINDLKTDSTQTLVPSDDQTYSQAGEVIWSPDGTKFVFVAGYGGDYGDDVPVPNMQTLILIDTNDMSQKVLIPNTEDYPRPLEWREDNVLVIEKTVDYINVPIREVIEFNFYTGQFQTPTPSP